VDNAPRFQPVLARLPDVSAELQLQRSEKKAGSGGVGYRIDPPQTKDSRPTAASSEHRAQFTTLKSELIYAPTTSRPHPPHVFGRRRSAPRPKPVARRESPILPRSNPFAIPSKRLIDSIAPVIQFLLLVALFTAACTWVQVAKVGRTGATKPNQPPTTTAQEPAVPAAKTAERAAAAPTSAGPVGSTPEPNTRVGRARENHDFARLRGDILPVPESTGQLGTATTDALATSSVPRVQLTELQKAGPGDNPARKEDSSRAPEIATLPQTTPR
jgi:hypothetical protein